MAITLNTTLKNTLLDGLDSTFNNGTLEILSAADVVLATITLPADAFAAASGGTKQAQGTWQDASADASGTAAKFRMTGGSNVLSGSVTTTGGGGDITLDSVSITAGQQVTITSFTMTSTN